MGNELSREVTERIKKRLEAISLEFGPEVLWAAAEQIWRTPASLVPLALQSSVQGKTTIGEREFTESEAWGLVRQACDAANELSELIYAVAPPDEDEDEDEDASGADAPAAGAGAGGRPTSPTDEGIF